VLARPLHPTIALDKSGPRRPASASATTRKRRFACDGPNPDDRRRRLRAAGADTPSALQRGRFHDRAGECRPDHDPVVVVAARPFFGIS
jgi:hypothetical protein